jgi:hypothetical protein
VKLCNDTVTVFNARVDPDAGGNVWTPTVIAGASWYLTDASTVDASKGGLVAANKATIRITEGADTGGKAYADPIAYRDAEDVSGLWTLQDGDIIVKGDASATTDPTPAKLKKAYADCGTVLGVTDNRRAPNAPHWKVTAT